MVVISVDSVHHTKIVAIARCGVHLIPKSQIDSITSYILINHIYRSLWGIKKYQEQKHDQMLVQRVRSFIIFYSLTANFIVCLWSIDLDIYIIALIFVMCDYDYNCH